VHDAVVQAVEVLPVRHLVAVCRGGAKA
jgi:hypothetical protein